MAKSFLTPLVRDTATPWRLCNSRSGRVLADHVHAAFDSESRRRGLLGRASFEEGHALVIAPSNAIHTFFMKFPIDVLFVRRDGTVVKGREAIGPWRISVALKAYAVIELPSGAVARSDTRAGDRLELVHSTLHENV